MDPARSSRLRYVDASDIEDTRVDFDGLDVYNAAGTKLGDVDGFIIDGDSNRPYYIVVDSGGWFSSQRYLVPIGHARLDIDNDRLRIDIEREAIERFPPFDASRFEEMPEDEARRFNEQTLLACCPNELKGRHLEGRWDYEKWSHYQVPQWWQARPVASTHQVPPPPTALDTHAATVSPREEIVARRTDSGLDSSLNDRPLTPVSDRAQPGDILGIENAGETTRLGDDSRDEEERRRNAEEAERKNRR